MRLDLPKGESAAVSAKFCRPPSCRTTVRRGVRHDSLASDRRKRHLLHKAHNDNGTTEVGRFAIATILATMFEKAARSPDQISSSEAHFRAMIDRVVEGGLHLEKSLFGLADTVLKRNSAAPS